MPDIFVSEDAPEEPTRYGRLSPEEANKNTETQQDGEVAPDNQPSVTDEANNNEGGMGTTNNELRTDEVQPLTLQTPQRVQTNQSFQPNMMTEEMSQPGEQSANNQEQPTINDQQFTYPAPVSYRMVQEKQTSGIPLFTSFWQNPQGVYFETQGAHEPILLFLRKHFITNVPWIMTVLIFILVPFGLNYLTQISGLNLDTLHILSPSDVHIAFAFYLIIVMTYAFIKFIGWYYNIFLITPERILDIELEDLVSKKIAETKISRVQDVQNVQTGTIRSILDYGDVLIQTAAAQDDFYIPSVPKPELVLKVVGGLIGKEGESGV